MDPLQPFQDEVRSAVERAIISMGAEPVFDMEIPSSGIADFAVPCFPLAKKLRKAPPLIAEELAANLPPTKLISRAWAEKGYLNFKVDDEKLVMSTLETIRMDREHYGKGEARPERVLLEHTSVNPTGPIHVGRARNPIHRGHLGTLSAQLRIQGDHRILCK